MSGVNMPKWFATMIFVVAVIVGVVKSFWFWLWVAFTVAFILSLCGYF